MLRIAVSLAVLSLLILVGGVLLYGWARRRTIRKIEAAMEIANEQWLIRRVNRDGNRGSELHLETNNQARRHQIVVFKLSHPDYSKLDHLKAGDIITFQSTKDPVYKDGFAEVSGFLRTLNISDGPW